MKYTSAQANKLLRKLNEDYAALAQNEKDSYLFIAALSEDPESVRPQYDYASTQAQMHQLEEKIRKLKHSINQFNVSTVVEEFSMTIDEMLVYIPQLTRKKQRLQVMKSKLPKSRVQQRYGSSSSIIDYEYINYDLEEVRKDFEEVSDELTRAQIALDTLNNSVEFDLGI
ncbi:MAG: hypothetical protein K6A14_02830 [Erysipelotrichaceae bacterium]|nr:hypothetical protein [Erysipelotrichaceae bacterium]